jgi:flagellar motor protein MotB
MQFTTRILALVFAIVGTSVSTTAQTSAIYFDVASATITAAAQKQLDDNIIAYKRAPGIIITGYADADGADAYNARLSAQRAEAVSDYLISKGVNASLIITLEKGETMSSDETADANVKQQDRRVDIRIASSAEISNLKGTRVFVTPERYKVKPVTVTFDPTKQNDIVVGNRGTVLHIPPDAFVDASGNLIKGPVTIVFTEYTNAGEIALSGLPMTIVENGKESRFSSSGMFELNGAANDQPIQIAKTKSIEIDYPLVGAQSNVGYYQLDKNKKWVKKSTVIPESTSGDDIKPEITVSKVRQPLNSIPADTIVVRDNGSSKLLAVRNTNIDTSSARLMANVFNSNMQVVGTTDSRDYTSNTVSRINTKLQVSGFGLYNCDQVVQFVEKVDITATFTDAKGNAIPTPTYISIIDKQLNGAFGYANGQKFPIDKASKTAIFIYTSDNKLYYLGFDELKKMNIERSGNYTFAMHDVSNTIKTTNDLQALLNK